MFVCPGGGLVFNIFTSCKQSLGRLCFHRSVCPRGGGAVSQHANKGADTLLGRHPPGRHPLGRHPLAVHAGIRSTSRRYASHWNAFLFTVLSRLYCFTLVHFIFRILWFFIVVIGVTLFIYQVTDRTIVYYQRNTNVERSGKIRSEH